MLVKPLLIAGTLSAISATPMVLTGVFDVPVRMSVGPIAAVFEPDNPVDLDLNAQCMQEGCPILSVEVGDSLRLDI
ncbi:MAG: hypothetical protein GYB36_01150 [Alphaproteobacteria bacterium]|nr:hypothetical protein [Alphaproteobacteria bacterium]